jgi:hypothetical protein
VAANNTVIVRFLGDVSNLAKSTAQINGQLAGLGKVAARLSGVFAAGLGLGAIGKQLGESIIAFSNLQEQVSAAGQVFGKSADELVKYADTTAEAFGMTQTEAIKAANQLGMYGDAMGFTAEQTREFAQEMITLSGDLAAFRDTDIDQAIQAIGSAFAGQSRPLRQYTIDTTDAAKVQALLARGIQASVGSMDKQTKALGTYYAILDQSTVMQGQAAREQEQTATQMRRLKAVTDELSVAFGKGLVEGLEDTNRALEGMIQNASEGEGAMERFGESVGQSLGVLADAVILLNKLGDKLNDISPGTNEAAGSVNKYLNKLTLLGGTLAPTAALLDLVTRETLEQKFAFENTGPAAEALTGSIQRLAAANRLLAESEVSDFATVAANKYYRDAGVRAKKLQDDIEETEDKINNFGGSVSSVSQKVSRDLTTILNDFDYTTVEFGRKTAKLSQKQDSVFEGMLTAFTAKVQKQEQIIADTLQQIEDAAAYAQDALSTFTGVNLDDFIEQDDAGNYNFLADKFNEWATDRSALAQALGPLASVLPAELTQQIIAMDTGPAMAVVNALDPTQNPETLNTLQTNLNNLVADTQKYLLPPMLEAWGYIGDEAAYKMLEDAKKKIEKDKTKFKKFVKKNLDTEVTVKVRYEYINPPNPVQTVQAYEARNGASWRG